MYTKNNPKIMLTVKTTTSPFDLNFNTIVKKFFNDEDIFAFNLSEKSSVLVNIKETDNSYQLELRVPGFNKENININIDGDNLKISGNVENSNEDTKDKYYRKEFYKSSFERTFQLPENIDKNKIEAKSKDGILTIDLGKKDVANDVKVKKIEIK